jgi:ketosteroid isomerase-like protein
MKRLVAGALALAAVAGGIWAAQTWAAQRYRERANNTDQAVLLADKALGRAVAAGDKKSIGGLLDRRFTFIDRSGRSFIKSQFVLNPPSWPPSDEEPAVRRYGRIGVVTGSNGSETSPDFVFLHVWLKRRGGWRALAFHETLLTTRAAGPIAVSAPAACENPCKRLPYQPNSPAEQEILAAFEAIETAVAGNDADAWAQYVADEFVVYRSTSRPATREERIAFIRARKEAGAPTPVAELMSMQLWVFGDVAVMTARHAWADGARLPYRATRVWVRRGGRWQIALSRHTEMEP